MTTAPTWAWAKIGRARALASECDAITAQWAGVARPRPEPKIADDRLSYEVRIRIGRPFPLEELALLTGDCIHNLRSALDVAVWSSARPDDLSAREHEALGFPLVVDPSNWAEVASRRLRTVPDQIVDRIAQVQPFQRPVDERDRDGLLGLHRLDIQDKHRLALATRVTLAEMSLDSQVEFSDETAASRNVPPDVTMHECALEDSGLVFTHRTVDPIVKIRGAFSLQWQVGMEVDGQFESASALLGGLAGLVTQVLGHVWPG